MELALVQLRRSRQLEENAQRVTRLIREAQGADLVLLPENWLGPFPVSLSAYISVLREAIALLSPATLVAGGAQYVRNGEKIYSRGVFLRPGSPPLGYYEKHFPSQPVGERAFLTPGRAMAVLDHAGFRIGALVCVDLFYPELARRLALKGCQLILNPVSIPAARLELWKALGLVRAAENTVFVAAANNTGSSYADGREIAGGSFVAFPDGTLGAAAGTEEGVLRVRLEQSRISEIRKRWPYLGDVRLSNCGGRG